MVFAKYSFHKFGLPQGWAEKCPTNRCCRSKICQAFAAIYLDNDARSVLDLKIFGVDFPADRDRPLETHIPLVQANLAHRLRRSKIIKMKLQDRRDFIINKLGLLRTISRSAATASSAAMLSTCTKIFMHFNL